MFIEIDGIAIEIIKKPIKSINIRIYPPNGLVKVSAPLKLSERLIRLELEAKIKWIAAQRKIMQNQPKVEQLSIQTGAQIDFLGKTYLLLVTEHHGPAHIHLDGQVIHFYIKPNCSETQKQNLLDQWYRQQMEARLPSLIESWQDRVGVRIAEYGIKKMKTRWGSCNIRAHRIWLNLNLIKKPLVCLEYVLVHELVHLLESGHNARFYRFMDQFMPDWRAHQALLERKREVTEPIA